jgi:predicted membrane-bound spermidine synthase
MGAVLFFLGCQAMVVQLLLMREMLASFSGNELTIGAGFGVWFAAIGAGAMLGRFAARHGRSDTVRLFLHVLLLGLALAPPVLLVMVVRAREVLGIPLYESLSFSSFVYLFLLVFGPVCLAQGAAFPIACRLAGEGRRQGVGRLYGLESAGGLIGGLGFGLSVVTGIAPLAMALVAAALGLAAFSRSLLRKPGRWVFMMAALAVVCLPWLASARLERLAFQWEALQWKALTGSASAVEARVETPYQRLTQVRLGDQHVLYGNHQPLFMFPDPVQTEPLVHAVLARHANPRRVLLIGGNPRDMGEALLKHRDCQVTYVEADEGIVRLTGLSDRQRFEHLPMDPVWYARQAKPGSFDVILLMAPEPETVGLNRFYTREFYGSLKGLLRQGGFLWTSVEASEQLQAETGLLAASVYKTLQSVFPEVKATFGSRMAFFAAEKSGDIPMDRDALAAAVERAGVQSEYFNPGMLLADEAIDPVKMEKARQVLEGLPVPVNSLIHPVTHTFMLLRWNRMSGSGLNRLLWRLAGLQDLWLGNWIAFGIGAAALVMAGLMMVLKGRKREAVVRGYLRLAIGVAGFSAMAFELILIFLAQSLFGYVYERLAFIVALFMAGLAAGSLLVRRFESGDSKAAWGLALAACAALVVLGVALPLGLERGLGDRRLTEWMLHGCMVAAGAAVGVLFPMINRLLRERGETLTLAAGSTHASDNAGAAFGSLVVGVVLVPALGVAMTCFIVAFANALLALGLVVARRVE